MLGRFFRYLKTANGKAAAVIVAACGLSLGYFVCRTFVTGLAPTYSIDFGDANWIEARSVSPAAYFRKNLYVTRPVEHAWLSLASTGSYELYVNNLFVDTRVMPAAHPAGVYDLTGIFRPGKNTIAIYVSADWSIGPREMIARGAYVEAGGEPVTFHSDSSWKTSPTGESVAGSVLWSASQYDDSGWQSVKRVEEKRKRALQRLPFDPRLFELEPVGKWVSSSTGDSNDATFSYEFELPDGVTAAWLQLAANGSYDAIVNDYPAILTSSTSQAVLLGPDAPVPIGPGDVRPASQIGRPIGPQSGLPGTRSSWSTRPGNDVSPSTLPYRRLLPPTLSAAADSLELSGERLPGNPAWSSTAANDYSAADAPTLDELARSRIREFFWKPGLSARVGTSLRLQVLQIPPNADTSALTPPGLGEVTPDPAPSAPQLAPLSTSPGPVPSAALALTAYDVREHLHSGQNRVDIRVRSTANVPVLLANALVETPEGQLQTFGTDDGWRVSSTSEGSARPHSAAVLGKWSAGPWGPPISVVASADPADDVSTAVRWLATVTVVLGLTIGIWFVAGRYTHSVGGNAEASWDVQAILHLALLVVLVVLFVSTFDIRLPYDWCFQKPLLTGVLSLFAFAAFCLSSIAVGGRPSDPGTGNRHSTPGWYGAGLLLIVFAGLAIRAFGLTTSPLGHDEVAMALMSRGVLEAGYPYQLAGSFSRSLSTYELVPYPIAFFTALLGPSTLAYRLPALLFGSAMIGLVGFVGKRMFDWRIGLMAALIWALLPIPINWSRDGFYLSQESFFALTTFWLFYEAVRERGLDVRYLRLATVAFVVTYFSWEASGFIIVSLIVAGLAVKWRERACFLNPNVWMCLGILTTVVFLQLCYRQLTLTPNYLGIIRDLSQVSTPGLVPFNRLVFDPLYYVKKLFLAENHVLLTSLVLLGAFSARRHRALLYVDVCLIVLYLSYTGLLEHYAPRYCFNWLALLVIGAVGSFFFLWDRIAAIPVNRAGNVIRTASFAMAAGIVVLGSNQYVLKLFRMAPDPSDPVWFDRIGVPFKADYDSSDKFVAGQLRDGDVVVTRAPHVFWLVTGRMPEYSINPLMVFRMFYDGGAEPPGYIDKWLGVRVIRSLDELKDARARARRVWVISDTPMPYSSDVITYLRIQGRLVFESTRQQVMLLEGASAISDRQRRST